jgi:hypothetical protein
MLMTVGCELRGAVGVPPCEIPGCCDRAKKSGLVSPAHGEGGLVPLHGTTFIVWNLVLLNFLIGDQARSTPIWFHIARVMSVPVFPVPGPESTKPIGVVKVAPPGFPTLLNVLNGAQRVPVSEHTSIGWIAM